jgi:hypothetical protein
MDCAFSGDALCAFTRAFFVVNYQALDCDPIVTNRRHEQVALKRISSFVAGIAGWIPRLRSGHGRTNRQIHDGRNHVQRDGVPMMEPADFAVVIRGLIREKLRQQVASLLS